MELSIRRGVKLMRLFDLFRRKAMPSAESQKTIASSGTVMSVSSFPPVKLDSNIKPYTKPLEHNDKDSQSVHSPALSHLQVEIDSDVIPAEVQSRTAIVDNYGLFPHEILVLDYANTFYTSGNTFQGFWWYGYGVRDVQYVLSSLMGRGFLTIGGLKSALNKQTVAALKGAMKLFDIKTTGKKADLVQRLLDEVSEEELSKQFPKRTYALTSTGQSALQESEYVPYIHRHNIEELDIWSMNLLVNSEPRMGYRDKIWRYLNEKSAKHFACRDYGLYRCSRLTMALFLDEEGKYKDEMALLAEVVCVDLNCPINGYNSEYIDSYAEYFFPYKNSTLIVPPGIIGYIDACQGKAGCSDEEMELIMMDRMNKIVLPLKIFTPEECVKIVLLERKGKVGALTNLYNKAKQAFRLKYPGIKV